MSAAPKSPRIRKIDISEIKALNMAEDSVAKMNPSAKRKILIGLFEKYRPGEVSPLKTKKNEFILKADIEDKLEELSLRKDVPKEKSALFEKHIFEQLWKEHQAEEEKNREANRETLKNQTKSKIKNLLEQQQEGKEISDEENAAAVLEQLEENQSIKSKVLQLLKEHYEGGKAKKIKILSEENDKAKQIVYRLLTMRNGRVAKIVYEELSPKKQVKKAVVLTRETNSYNYTHLEKEVEEFQKNLADFQAEATGEEFELLMEMEGENTSYAKIDKALEQLKNVQQKEKKRLIANMEEYLEAAYKKYQEAKAPLEKRISMGRSLILLLRFISKNSSLMEKLESTALEFLHQIRKDNEQLGSRTKSSRTSVQLENPLKKAA